MKREYIVSIDFIAGIPPDNEELVRCKNCVKREYDNCPFNEFTMYKPADDFFCGAGSREWEEEK